MKIKRYDAPHIRHRESTRILMLDTMLALLCIYVMAYYYYGMRAVMLGVVSIGTSVIADTLSNLSSRRRLNTRDFSPVVTGMLLPLLMPASISYSVVVTAALFAILVAKHPFGGVGHNVFNPAAAGFSFAAICFSDRMFLYPRPRMTPPLPVFEAVDPAGLGTASAYTLHMGGIPKLDLTDMALGNFAGPMGATNSLVILACLLYLIFRKAVRPETPLFFFGTVAAFALLFPAQGAGVDPTFALRVQMLVYELMSGFLLLGGVFLLGDPVTTPKRGWSKMAFSVAAGIMVMLFRRFGAFEESFTFAVLLMNATVWGFDMVGERVARVVRRRAGRVQAELLQPK